jgi:hypothetical protein
MEPAETREVLQQAMGRARADEGFRADFTADPAGAIEKGFGVRLPGSLDAARLRERVRGRFGLEVTDGELDDGQLEQVAGGFCVCI